MADKREPVGQAVNGAYLFVKDPEATSGLFEHYQRVSGLSSFTLPAEVGGTNEIQLMDGVIAFASRKGVGTVTGVLGARTAHPAQQFMEQRSLDGRKVEIAMVKLASGVLKLEAEAAAAVAVAGVGGYKIDLSGVLAGWRTQVKNTIKAAHAVAILPDLDALSDSPKGVAVFDAAQATANDALFQVIQSVEEDGSEMYVSPGFVAARGSAATKKLGIFFINPGLYWTNVLGTVNGFDAGDFQQGSAVSGNFTFTPESMPRGTATARRSFPKTGVMPLDDGFGNKVAPAPSRREAVTGGYDLTEM